MKEYILSIDQGTTSTRAIIFDKSGNIISTNQMEFTQICPKSGWVLHNPLEILQTVKEVVKNALNQKSLTLDDIDSVGITNQRETTVVWDKITNKPIYDAICWQSRQSNDICEDLIKKGYKDLFFKKTGLLINPYFSGSKIKWILDNADYDSIDNLLFGTIDTYLLYNLTVQKSFYTDYTNASRTMLFNIKELRWDDELLHLLKIPKSMLPEVKESGFYYGDLVIEGVKGQAPIMAIMGDQQASLFGQCAFDKGDIKNTYGTGCFMLMNIGEKPVYSDKGLLTTIAYSYNNQVKYALEGSVFIAGAAIKWLRDGLKFFLESKESEEYAKLVEGYDCVVVPAFVGLGTPYWDNDVRGSILGLSRETNRYHITKATLEAIAYQSKDVLDVMTSDARRSISSLSVDGGASANDYLLQFQADVLNTKIARPKCLETTALGVAYMAGLHTGFYKDLDEVKANHQIEKFYFPQKNQDLMEKLYEKWKKAVYVTRLFK